MEPSNIGVVYYREHHLNKPDFTCSTLQHSRYSAVKAGTLPLCGQKEKNAGRTTGNWGKCSLRLH